MRTEYKGGAHPVKRIHGLVVLWALCLAGCLQVEETITLLPDGSGTLELSYAVPAATAEELESAFADEGANGSSGGEGGGLNFDEAAIREEFKELESFGVTLESVSSGKTADWETMRMKVRFTSLDGLARTPLMSDRAMTLKKERGGSYILRQTSATAAAAGGTPGADDPEMEQMIRDMMKGFKVAVRINTPGKVLDTSAPEHDNGSASWVFDLDQDPKALEKLAGLDMWIRFDGSALDLPVTDDLKTEIK